MSFLSAYFLLGKCSVLTLKFFFSKQNQSFFLSSLELKRKNKTTLLNCWRSKFHFPHFVAPPCFSFERRVERREKEREKESFCSRCGRVVGMSFTVTTTTALNTRGLRMQNSSTLVGKRIGQKRGTFVNENRNTKERNGSRGIPIKAEKQGGD